MWPELVLLREALGVTVSVVFLPEVWCGGWGLADGAENRGVGAEYLGDGVENREGVFGGNFGFLLDGWKVEEPVLLE